MSRRFSDSSLRAQLFAFSCVCALIVAGAWQVLLGPARADLAGRRSTIVSLRVEISRAELTARKLPALERDLHALEGALQRSAAILPDERDAQDVLRNLHELASDSALEVNTFAPKPIVTRAHYSEWPIQVGLAGGYHDLGRFFGRIAAMPQLMSVSDLQIKVNPKPTDRHVIIATCVATTFVFKKDDALGAATPVAGAMAGGSR